MSSVKVLSSTDETTLNVAGVTLYSVYIILGLYLVVLVCQRMTYTMDSPKLFVCMRCVLMLMIVFWIVFSCGLYLFSCFIDAIIAETSSAYKTAFYIELYYSVLLWPLCLMFMAYCVRFKAVIHTRAPLSTTEETAHAAVDAPTSPLAKSSMGPKKTSAPSADTATSSVKYSPLKIAEELECVDFVAPDFGERALSLNDIEAQDTKEQSTTYDDEHDKHHTTNKSNKPTAKHFIPSTSGSAVDALTPMSSVYDHTKHRHNQRLFLITFYVFGCLSLLFSIAWLATHSFMDESCTFTDTLNMPRWQCNHHHDVQLVLELALTVLILFLAVYSRKEFWNTKVTFYIAITLLWNFIAYWILYFALPDDIFMFLSPMFYYVLFFACHTSDAARDEHPPSQIVTVHEHAVNDRLDMFYKVWSAKPQRKRMAPNLFCFGPSPLIDRPQKTTAIILGSWASLKEDYAGIAHALSLHQRNVIVVDYRGVGETGLGGEGEDHYSAEQYANDIMEFVKGLIVHHESCIGIPAADCFVDQSDETIATNWTKGTTTTAIAAQPSRLSPQTTEDAKDDDFYANFRRNSKYAAANKDRKVYLIGLSMGANVALQCALHADSKQYLRGVVACSGHGGGHLLTKGQHFEAFGNAILSGNALHYGHCADAVNYMHYAHSEEYRASWRNRCRLISFYFYHLSAHPHFCCNCAKSKNNRSQRKERVHKQSIADASPTLDRSGNGGMTAWFERKFTIDLRVSIKDKHSVLKGIRRQTDVAEDNFNIANECHNISIPTLIYHGSKDTVINPATAELLSHAIGPDSCAEQFEDGGHNFWFEDPQRFCDEIESFMAFNEESDIANGGIM